MNYKCAYTTYNGSRHQISTWTGISMSDFIYTRSVKCSEIVGGSISKIPADIGTSASSYIYFKCFWITHCTWIPLLLHNTQWSERIGHSSTTTCCGSTGKLNNS